MQKKYDLVVFIGRLQPLHNGHVRAINRAFELSDNVAVLLGSNNKPRSAKNPFDATAREDLIRETFPASENNLFISSIPDSLYQDYKWVEHVNAEIGAAADHFLFDFIDNPRIALIGHFKDKSSYYLKMFPHIALEELPAEDIINATDIRAMLFEMENNIHLWRKLGALVPEPVLNYLQGFINSKAGWALALEHTEIKQQIAEMMKYKYAAPGKGINTVAVDAVVYHPSGKVLMVRRGGRVGHGLLALPGGYLEPGERIFDGCLRELLEETGIDLSDSPRTGLRTDTDLWGETLTKAELKRAFVAAEVFDHPDRSQIGRIITHAHLFVLDIPFLPVVKGADDADAAMWIKVADLPSINSRLFDDHTDIIERMMQFVR